MCKNNALLFQKCLEKYNILEKAPMSLVIIFFEFNWLPKILPKIKKLYDCVNKWNLDLANRILQVQY